MLRSAGDRPPLACADLDVEAAGLGRSGNNGHRKRAHWRRGMSGLTNGFVPSAGFGREWSRREFLRLMGRTAGFATLAAGPLEITNACAMSGPGRAAEAVRPRMGGHLT